MEPILNLLFAIALLLITLSLAFSYLAIPMGILRRSGALWAVRRIGRGLRSIIASLLGVVVRRRRPRARRGHLRTPTSYFR